jgi:hypothetical protein
MSVTPAQLLKITQLSQTAIEQRKEKTRKRDIEAFWKESEPLMMQAAALGHTFLKISRTIPSKHDVAKDARERGFSVDMPDYDDDCADYFIVSWDTKEAGNKRAREEEIE